MLMALLSLMVSSCQSLMEVRFEVDPSALDFVQLVRHDSLPDDRINTTVIELQGSGYLTIRQGTGDRVRDGFWTEASIHSPAVYQSHRILTASQTQQQLQRVVDAGAFDMNRRNPPDRVLLFVQTKIGGRNAVFATGEPAFSELMHDLEKRVSR